jgi:LysR family transcriptional regulator, transcription activator of glutamate synthase operon
MNGMDLLTVRWFLAVAEHGHVTRAATLLRISQPGLSRAIARLEHELGVPLFDRAGRNVRLNRYGEIFREHAERLVAEEESARRSLGQALDPGRGEISLGFLHTQGTALVPDLLRRYRPTHRNVTFRLMQDGSERIEQALRDGSADLGITGPRPDDPALAWHPLSTERLRLAVPAGHRLAARAKVSLTEVAAEPHIVLRRGYGLRSITDELYRQADIAPEIAFEGEEIGTVRGLVAAGLGVAVVPPSGSDGIELDDPGARRTIGLVWVAAHTRPPVVEAFRRFVME